MQNVSMFLNCIVPMILLCDQKSKWPAYRFNKGDTHPNNAYHFLVWWKMKCHGSYLLASYSFFLGVRGPLMLGGLLWASVFDVVCHKEVDSLFFFRSEEKVKFLFYLFLKYGVCRPGYLIPLVNISGLLWCIVLWIL